MRNPCPNWLYHLQVSFKSRAPTPFPLTIYGESILLIPALGLEGSSVEKRSRTVNDVLRPAGSYSISRCISSPSKVLRVVYSLRRLRSRRLSDSVLTPSTPLIGILTLRLWIGNVMDTHLRTRQLVRPSEVFLQRCHSTQLTIQ